MKRLFFYANFRTYDMTLGITRKVYLEIKAFQKLGYDVTYSGYTKTGVAIFDNSHNVIIEEKYRLSSPKIQHAIRRWKLMWLCTSFVKRTDVYFDLSYIRYHFFDRTFLKMLKSLKESSRKVVMEAHSTPKFTNNLSVMNLVGRVDSKYGKYAHKYIDLIASMSGEENMWGVNTIQITNAIDFDNITPHTYKGSKEDISFISVSYERDVHGYDRLIRGIYEYKKRGGNRNIYFHMVGSTLQSSIALIKKLNLEDVCRIHGPLYGEKLDEIYDMSNVGVGCLANHRIGSFYGSALKTKEYIAKGIPFIYGWKEAVLENFEYGLEFELCEDPIDIEKVISFYDNLDKTDLVSKIRGKLGKEDKWDFQMEKVINAVANIN